MAIRNATSNFTFEQWRVEFNELAADVGDISAGITGSVPSGASTYTTVETALEALVTDVNNIINGTHNFTGDATFGGNVDITGNLTIGGLITIGDNAASDRITVNATLESDLIPEATNTKDIGSSTKSWRNLYIGTEATLATAKISNLNSTEIPVAGTDGLLDGSNSLTFSSLTLTTPNISVGTEATLASAKISNLNSGQIPIAGTAGLLAGDADLTFSGSTLTATNLSVSQLLDVTGDATFGDDVTVTDNLVVSGTGQSTSSTTGAVTVAGGAGVVKDLYVGGSIVAGSNISIAGSTPFTTEGFSIAMSVALG